MGFATRLPNTSIGNNNLLWVLSCLCWQRRCAVELNTNTVNWQTNFVRRALHCFAFSKRKTLQCSFEPFDMIMVSFPRLKIQLCTTEGNNSIVFYSLGLQWCLSKLKQQNESLFATWAVHQNDRMVSTKKSKEKVN